MYPSKSILGRYLAYGKQLDKCCYNNSAKYYRCLILSFFVDSLSALSHVT